MAMEDGWKRELAKLIASTRNYKEASDLLEGLLTPGEYEELAKRWQIVKMMLEGKSHRYIKDSLGVSIATVTRGSRELKYGNGIFQKIYKKMQNSTR